VSLGLNLCCSSTRGDPTAHELDAIAIQPLVADDNIMPTESRESRAAGGRIEAATLLECSLVEAIGGGCKHRSLGRMYSGAACALLSTPGLAARRAGRYYT